MKKTIAIILLFILCFGAYADSEWSQYSDDELIAMIDDMSERLKDAKAELESRKTDNDDSITAYDKDGHKYMLSNMREGESFLYERSIDFDYVYENNSDGRYTLVITNCFVNGWETGSLGSLRTTPGNKEKNKINIGLDNTDISNLDEVVKIELVFGYMDEKYNITEFEPVTVFQK